MRDLPKKVNIWEWYQKITMAPSLIMLMNTIKGNIETLRIPAIHGAKTTKTQTPLVRFAWLFYNQTDFQNFEHSFFDQVVIDAKKYVNIWKAPSGGRAEIENIKNC